MIPFQTLDTSIISLIILIFIYTNLYNSAQKAFIDYKLFINLIRINIIMLIVEFISWIFNGVPGSLNNIANIFFNTLLYIIEPSVALVWILYIDYQVFHNTKRLYKLKNVLLIIFCINAAASVINIYTGWFFTINSENIYSRANYFWLHLIVFYGTLVYSIFFILRNQRLLEKKYYYSMLFFTVPFAVAGTMQALFYGPSYTWSGLMLSNLVIYFNLQNRGLNTDYLTGLYNRRQLDNYLDYKIRSSTEEKGFAGILIDINAFKQINDKYGHDMGDEALRDAASIIKGFLNNRGFAARYGGDEFLIIMDIKSKQMLEEAVEKLKENADTFNTEAQKSYKLSFSLGYDIYDYKSKLSSDEFFKHIDKLMYNNKLI